MRNHPYTYRQGFSLVGMVARPTFAYSVALTAWTFNYLRVMIRHWGLMGKWGWSLTNGHNVAPFETPGEEGEVMQFSLFTVAAKHSHQLFSKTCTTLAGDFIPLH
eukprot:1705712-Rhodomonas_salina.1